jgi:hypothetical protein
LIIAIAVSAVLTPYVDAANPHTNAPIDAPSHTISIASDEPRPRTQSGNCTMNVENIVVSIAMVPRPHTKIAPMATEM